jgi:hypothetical protein
MLRILLIVALGSFVGSNVSAQGFQKLLESTKSGAAGGTSPAVRDRAEKVGF